MFDKLSYFFLRRRNWTLPYALFLLIFAIVPLLLIVLYAFTDADGAFTFANFRKFMMHPEAMNTFIYSIGIALISSLTCLLLGYPIAYYIARSEQKKQNALILVIKIPMWINMLVRTYAWIGLLSDGGLIQRILQLVGLGKGSLLYTEEAVLLGMVYNFLPFMILQIQTSLSKMDNSLLEASADLGASPAQTFKRVTLPLSVPGIINGITLVFLPAVSSFFIPKLLGGGQYFLIGNMIENQFITVGEWNFGSAISMIMAVIMMVLMMVVRKIEIRNQGGKGV